MRTSGWWLPPSRRLSVHRSPRWARGSDAKLDGPTANLPYKHLQKMVICLVNGKDGFFVLLAPVKTLLGSGRIRCSRATRLNLK